MNAGKSSGMIVGPLATDPIYSETNKGTSILTAVIRVDNGYTPKDGQKVERIEGVPVKFIGNTALAANALKLQEGDVVVCPFHTSGREHDGKYYSEIVGDGIERLSQVATATESTVNQAVETSGVPVDDDDLPF